MPFKSDVIVRINKQAIKRGLIVPVATEYVKSAQRIVATAKRDHPYTDRTGNNTRRIGWAVSGPDDTQFGPLTTGAGQIDSSGADKESKRGEIDVIVATSSGYGGYLEIGTRKMNPYPYIYPAYERDKPKLDAALTNIAGKR